ncbi:MAG TPA: HlyD family type I secretion periplasmic adaptor subunit [Burkholderiales bacterium]
MSELAMTPDVDFRTPLRRGAALLLFGFGGFLAWAALAPLDEAVPASGIVSIDGKRKRIDHLAGGLVEKILVREGEHVKQGQDLVVLDAAQSKAALNAALSQWQVAKATEARLVAERDGLKAIAFPAQLREAARDAEAAIAMAAQERLFRARRNALDGELRILRESVRGLEEQLASLDALRAGRQKQVDLLKQQLESFQKLSTQGFVSRNHLMEQERQLADVQGKQSEDLSNIAALRARLAEFRMRGAQREAEYRREVEVQLADVQREAATLGEKLAAQRDTYTRLAIRAPVSGTVVDLEANTVGGVVKPGDRIMEIVPSGDDLVVEARLAPQYIDRVHPGLPVHLHFDAYMNRADRPVIGGKVDVVSADALTDTKTGQSYYAMRIRVPAEERKGLGDLQLLPGMQATVMVKTGERALLVYLARPLLRRFTAALAER